MMKYSIDCNIATELSMLFVTPHKDQQTKGGLQERRSTVEST